MNTTSHIKEIIRKIKRNVPFVNIKKVVKIEPKVRYFLPVKFHPFLMGMSLKNKKLIIKVNNNATLMELQNFYRKSILNYLQNALPENCKINDVIFKSI